MMTHRIDIPTRDPQREALNIVTRTLRECGMDPLKAMGNPMGAALVREWTFQRMTESQFRHSIRNLLILNPTLRCTTYPA
jgi:alpha-beta hydrolase superfamily lysophospholipase